MEIRKLQKRLLKEERRRIRSRGRLLRSGLLLVLLLFAGGVVYRYNGHWLVQRQFRQAQALVDQEHYQQAAEVYQDLYRHHPGSSLAPKALLAAGQVLDLYLGQERQALLSLLLVEKAYPQSPAALKAQRRVAQLYKFRLRDYARAVVAYQRLLDAGVADGDRVRYQLADAYFQLGNFEQARIEFAGLLKRWPQSALAGEVRYRIAACLALDGNQDAAAEAYRALLDEPPAEPFATAAALGLAGVLEQQGKLRAALAVLEKLPEPAVDRDLLQQKISQVKARIHKKKRAL